MPSKHSRHKIARSQKPGGKPASKSEPKTDRQKEKYGQTPSGQTQLNSQKEKSMSAPIPPRNQNKKVFPFNSVEFSLSGSQNSTSVTDMTDQVPGVLQNLQGTVPPELVKLKGDKRVIDEPTVPLPVVTSILLNKVQYPDVNTNSFRQPFSDPEPEATSQSSTNPVQSEQKIPSLFVSDVIKSKKDLRNPQDSNSNLTSSEAVLSKTKPSVSEYPNDEKGSDKGQPTFHPGPMEQTQCGIVEARLEHQKLSGEITKRLQEMEKATSELVQFNTLMELIQSNITRSEAMPKPTVTQVDLRRAQIKQLKKKVKKAKVKQRKLIQTFGEELLQNSGKVGSVDISENQGTTPLHSPSRSQSTVSPVDPRVPETLIKQAETTQLQPECQPHIPKKSQQKTFKENLYGKFLNSSRKGTQSQSRHSTEEVPQQCQPAIPTTQLSQPTDQMIVKDSAIPTIQGTQLSNIKEGKSLIDSTVVWSDNDIPDNMKYHGREGEDIDYWVQNCCNYVVSRVSSATPELFYNNIVSFLADFARNFYDMEKKGTNGKIDGHLMVDLLCQRFRAPVANQNEAEPQKLALKPEVQRSQPQPSMATPATSVTSVTLEAAMSQSALATTSQFTAIDVKSPPSLLDTEENVIPLVDNVQMPREIITCLGKHGVVKDWIWVTMCKHNEAIHKRDKQHPYGVRKNDYSKDTLDKFIPTVTEDLNHFNLEKAILLCNYEVAGIFKNENMIEQFQQPMRIEPALGYTRKDLQQCGHEYFCIQEKNIHIIGVSFINIQIAGVDIHHYFHVIPDVHGDPPALLGEDFLGLVAPVLHMSNKRLYIGDKSTQLGYPKETYFSLVWTTEDICLSPLGEVEFTNGKLDVQPPPMGTILKVYPLTECGDADIIEDLEVVATICKWDQRNSLTFRIKNKNSRMLLRIPKSTFIAEVEQTSCIEFRREPGILAQAISDPKKEPKPIKQHSDCAEDTNNTAIEINQTLTDSLDKDEPVSQPEENPLSPLATVTEIETTLDNYVQCPSESVESMEIPTELVVPMEHDNNSESEEIKKVEVDLTLAGRNHTFDVGSLPEQNSGRLETNTLETNKVETPLLPLEITTNMDTTPDDHVQCTLDSVEPVGIPEKDMQSQIHQDHCEKGKQLKSNLSPSSHSNTVVISLTGMKYFSHLELSTGYWQTPANWSKFPLNVFGTPIGLYEFKAISSGPTNVSATLQHCMANFLHDLMGHGVFVHTKKILIYTETYDAHEFILRDILERLMNNHLKLNVPKCQFRSGEVEYFGYVISSQGIRPDDKHVDAIEKMEPPKTITENKEFLDMLYFFHQIIPDFVTLSKPLRNFSRETEGTTVMQWGSQQQEAFDKLRVFLKKKPILAFPNNTRPYLLFCNTSKYGISGALCQTDDNESLYPVGFASRPLLKAELLRFEIDTKCFATVWLVGNFQPLITGHTIHVFTDHEPLGSVWNTNPTMILERFIHWGMEPSQYNFTIEYLPDIGHAITNYLCKNPSEWTTEQLKNHQRPDHISPETKENDGLNSAYLLEVQDEIQSQKDSTVDVLETKEIEIPPDGSLCGEFDINDVDSPKLAIEMVNQQLQVGRMDTSGEPIPDSSLVDDPCQTGQSEELNDDLQQPPQEQLSEAPKLEQDDFDDSNHVCKAQGEIRVEDTSVERPRTQTSNIPTGTPELSFQSFLYIQCSNPKLANIIAILQQSESQGIPVPEAYGEYELIDGSLYRKPENQYEHRLCVPYELIPLLLDLAYYRQSSSVLYDQQKSMLHILSEHHYWSNMANDIISWVNEKTTHQQVQQQEEEQKELPGKSIVMNMIGPLSISKDGNQYIVTLVDQSTKFPMAQAVPEVTIETLTCVFDECVTSIFGYPEELVLNDTATLLIVFLKDFCKAHNIRIRHDTSHQCVSTCSCEPPTRIQPHLDGNLLVMIDNYCSPTPLPDWDYYLKSAVLILRTFSTFTMKELPHPFVSAQGPYIPLHMMFDLNPLPIFKGMLEYKVDGKKHVRHAWNTMFEMVKGNVITSRQYYNLHQQQSEIEFVNTEDLPSPPMSKPLISIMEMSETSTCDDGPLHILPPSCTLSDDSGILEYDTDGNDSTQPDVNLSSSTPQESPIMELQPIGPYPLEDIEKATTELPQFTSPVMDSGVEPCENTSDSISNSDTDLQKGRENCNITYFDTPVPPRMTVAEFIQSTAKEVDPIQSDVDPMVSACPQEKDSSSTVDQLSCDAKTKEIPHERLFQDMANLSGESRTENLKVSNVTGEHARFSELRPPESSSGESILDSYSLLFPPLSPDSSNSPVNTAILEKPCDVPAEQIETFSESIHQISGRPPDTEPTESMWLTHGSTKTVQILSEPQIEAVPESMSEPLQLPIGESYTGLVKQLPRNPISRAAKYFYDDAFEYPENSPYRYPKTPESLGTFLFGYFIEIPDDSPYWNFPAEHRRLELFEDFLSAFSPVKSSVSNCHIECISFKFGIDRHQVQTAAVKLRYSLGKRDEEFQRKCNEEEEQQNSTFGSKESFMDTPLVPPELSPPNLEENSLSEKFQQLPEPIMNQEEVPLLTKQMQPTPCESLVIESQELNGLSRILMEPSKVESTSEPVTEPLMTVRSETLLTINSKIIEERPIKDTVLSPENDVLQELEALLDGFGVPRHSIRPVITPTLTSVVPSVLKKVNPMEKPIEAIQKERSPLKLTQSPQQCVITSQQARPSEIQSTSQPDIKRATSMKTLLDDICALKAQFKLPSDNGQVKSSQESSRVLTVSDNNVKHESFSDCTIISPTLPCPKCSTLVQSPVVVPQAEVPLADIINRHCFYFDAFQRPENTPDDVISTSLRQQSGTYVYNQFVGIPLSSTYWEKDADYRRLDLLRDLLIITSTKVTKSQCEAANRRLKRYGLQPENAVIIASKIRRTFVVKERMEKQMEIMRQVQLPGQTLDESFVLKSSGRSNSRRRPPRLPSEGSIRIMN